MTLIAAFKCAEGALICADSQETIGDQRVARVKIEPFSLDGFELAMGGSGDGDILDAFVQALKDEWKSGTVRDVDALGRFIQRELARYIRQEVSLFAEERRAMKFLIVASCLEPAGLRMWETKAARLIPVSNYALAGSDYTVYERAVARHYRDSLTIASAIPLAMYVMALAEDTSNYVRSPFTLIAATDQFPMYVEEESAVKQYAEKTEIFTRQLENMLLTCADSTVPGEDFAAAFREFSETILRLRSDYLETAGELQISDFFSGRMLRVPFRRLPKGAFLAFGREAATVVEGEEEVERAVGKIRGFVSENKGTIERMREAITRSASQKSEGQQ